MLTIDISGNGNTDGASLQADGGPGNLSQPGFVNVGLSPTHGAAVNYLGNGWIITANHVSFSDPNHSVSFAGNIFTTDTDSNGHVIPHIPTNPDHSSADLALYHLSTTPNLPSLMGLIDSSTPSGRVIMIGNGLNLGTQEFWHVNKTNPTWQWTPESQPVIPGSSDFSGYDVVGSNIIRWGENNVSSTNVLVNDGVGITNTYTTVFDNSSYTHRTPSCTKTRSVRVEPVICSQNLNSGTLPVHFC